MRLLLASAVLILLPATASAESYDVLSWNPDHLVAIDKDSVEGAGDLKRVWITVIYAKPRTDLAQPYRGMVGHQEFDCAQGRFHTLESRSFDDAGAPIVDQAIQEPTPWTPVVAGALGEDERARLCRGQWSATLYQTRLATLLAAYRLRPDPPPSHMAAGQAPAAAQYGADAAAGPGDPPRP